MVALDHPVERFPVDREDTGCCLLVSASVTEYAGDVSTFDFRNVTQSSPGYRLVAFRHVEILRSGGKTIVQSL